MYKVFGFLTKRDGLSVPEFKDYYENHHVPLLLSRAPKPLIHKRRYPIRLCSKRSHVRTPGMRDLFLGD